MAFLTYFLHVKQDNTFVTSLYLLLTVLDKRNGVLINQAAFKLLKFSIY